MAIDNLHAEMCYLLDPAFQIEGVNGKPLIGGHLEVYLAGTDTKYITYQDWDGNENPHKIPLRSDGRAVVLADPSFTYDIYAYDSYNNLAFSRLNVQCCIGGDISITGKETIIYNTDGTLDVTLQNIENNTNRYIINSHHKEFGVKDPYLYFDTDTPEATIIAFSADTTPTDLVSAIGGKGIFASDVDVNASVFNNYVNTATFNTYSADVKVQIDAKQDKLTAGKGIDITENVISVTAGQGHTYTGEGIIKVDNVNDTISADISNLATTADATKSKTEVTAGANIDVATSVGADGHSIYTVSGKDWSNDIAAKLDTTAFSTVSGTFLTAHQSLSDYATTADVATKLDTTAFSTVSGNFITAHQSLDGLMSADKIEYAGDKITAYNGSAFAGGSEGKTYTGAGIIDVNNTTNVISANVSNLATTGALQNVVDDLLDEVEDRENADIALGNRIDNKLDTTAFSTVSGTFLTAHQSLENYATTADVANKLDTTAFSTVSGTFLTAHQPLYGLMSANKIEFDNNGHISGYYGSAFAGKEYEGIAPIYVNGDKISADLSDYATTASITGKQDELTPGDGIKIENNIISVTASGLDYVHRDNTLSGNGTTESPLGVSSLTELAVDDTMTAYDVDNTLVLGVNSTYFATTADLTAKQDVLTFTYIEV